MPRRLPCGCVPDHTGFGWCGTCIMNHRKEIWKRMSEKEKNYDRHFAPEQNKELNESYGSDPDAEYNTGCSCHINPPCSYCTRDVDEDNQKGA